MAVKDVVIVVLLGGAMLSASAESPKVARESTAVRARLVDAKARLMAADYRSDLATLASVRDGLAPLIDDPSLGYLASYWSGYASWRIAINGASAKMSQEDLKANLERALADFNTSIGKKDDFADSYAAAASINGWLMAFYRDDPAAFKQHLEDSKRLLAKAEQLAPSNPRVLWVRGGVFLFTPPQYGGSMESAIEIYRKQADASTPPAPQSPLPDWGKPEALMSLSYTHLSQASPDLASATEEAQAALRLQPEWHYVRDILVPMIDAARKQSASKASCTPSSR
ncbi:MAG: hypothetical protein ACXV7D_08315 [Thermoanaerobaculia bacterium]